MKAFAAAFRTIASVVCPEIRKRTIGVLIGEGTLG